MGREVRMVPPDWKHPKDAEGRYIGLMKGPYSQRVSEWDQGKLAWDRGEVQDWSKHDWDADNPTIHWRPKTQEEQEIESFDDWDGERPVALEYMPEFSEGTATHLMMYENTSEGTPISPAFDTPENLARWLADNDASSFGGMTATYEQWLATCKSGWAPSMVMGGGELRSGVAALAEE